MSENPLDDAIAKLGVAKDLCDGLIEDQRRQRRLDRLIGAVLALLIVTCIVSFRFF